MVGFNSWITIDEIIHSLEAFSKCVCSTIFSAIYSVIYSATKPWSQRLLKADCQIDIPVRQLEFRLRKAAFFAEAKDVGDASAPGFHQAALEEDFADEFVEGLRLRALIETFRRCARRNCPGVSEFHPIVEDGEFGLVFPLECAVVAYDASGLGAAVSGGL